MHFWIDKRSSQLHHYGRRGRLGPGSGGFYSGTFGSHHSHHRPNNNRRDSFNRLNNSQQNQHQQQNNSVQSPAVNHLQQNSSTSGTNSNTSNSGSTMVTPVHRFQPIESAREQAQLASRLTLAAAAAAHNQSNSIIGNSNSINNTASNFNGLGRGDANDIRSSARRSFGFHSQNQDNRSRSQSRERNRGQRSSSGRRHLQNNNSAVNGNIPPELQHLTSSVTSGNEESSLPPSPPNIGEESQEPQMHLLPGNPMWTRAKRIGLTLCFMAVILLCTVAAKFLIQGPGIIDTSRRGQSEAVVYFFVTELIFVAFAMALFFAGVACLRKRTNDYLLRQFNEHILQSSARAAIGGGAMNDYIDYYDTISQHNSGVTAGENDESQQNFLIQHHHLHNHHLLPGAHINNNNCRHGSHFNIVTDSVFSSGGGNTSSGRNGGSSRNGGKPPPYHIALYLPLPSQEESDSQFIDRSDKTNSMDKSEDEDEEWQENSVLSKPSVTGNPDRPETPPPSYEQFNFEI